MGNAPRKAPVSFSPENCATCDGHGIGPSQKKCGSCEGKGRILVMQPSRKCPRCNGSGKPEKEICWSVDHCVICRGTGWVWTEFHVAADIIRGAATSGFVSGSSPKPEDEK
jgi:DnaJ-class molecular chaperone